MIIKKFECYSTVYASKTWLGVADPGSIPSTSKILSVGNFQVLNTLTDFQLDCFNGKKWGESEKKCLTGK